LHQRHRDNQKYLRIGLVVTTSVPDEAPPYESQSYLQHLSAAKLNKILMKLKRPLETDQRENIINLNWSVDWIMKNSQSYNKESGAVVAEQVLTGSIKRQ
jgi:hypothetical protein